MRTANDFSRLSGRSTMVLACALFATLLSLCFSLDASAGNVPMLSTDSIASTNPSIERAAYLRTLLPEEQMKVTPCGPASMAMALTILGAEFTNGELSVLSNEDGETDFATLYDYARGKGLFAEAVSLLPQNLERLRNVAILQEFPTASGMWPGRDFHFVVFAGPAKRPGYVYVYDPVGPNGWRGPERVEVLSHKLTGKALVLSRFPLNLSEVLGAVHVGGVGYMSRWRFASAGLAISLLAAGIVMIVARRNRSKVLDGTGTRLSMIVIVAWLSMSGFAAEAGPTAQGNNAKALLTSKYVEGPCVYEAGNVPVGEKLTREFGLVNPNTEPISIKVGRSNCQCLSARIVGPEKLAPGERSSVVVDIRTEKGGQRVSWVELRVSGEQNPILLRVETLVVDDTSMFPEVLAFSEMRFDDEPQKRLLRVRHHGKKGTVFSITRAVGSASFLRISSYTGATEKQSEKDVVEYTCDLTVILDPSVAARGTVSGKILLTAMVGTEERQFIVPCTGVIVGQVTARPSRIVRIEKVTPEEVEVGIKLEANDKKKVVVADVQAEGIEMIKWRQEPGADNTRVVLAVRFKSGMTSDRKEAVCKVRFAEREGETLSIPVLLVETGGDSPG